jgi:hypothetical protein
MFHVEQHFFTQRLTVEPVEEKIGLRRERRWNFMGIHSFVLAEVSGRGYEAITAQQRVL